MVNVRPGMVKRILITNVHSYWNAGDAALTDVSIGQLEAAFPEAHITLVMNDPESYHGHAAIIPSFSAWCKDAQNRWRGLSPFVLFQALIVLLLYRLLSLRTRLFLSQKQTALLNAYFEADLVVSCAGNFLYTSGRIGLPFLLSILGMAYAVWSGKPLYALPQSVGPISRRWQQTLVRWIIRKSRLFMIRDTVSWAFLEAINANMDNAQLVPDIAFAMPEVDYNAGIDLLRAYGVRFDVDRPLLGVTAMNWGGQQRAFDGQPAYESALVEALNWYVETYRGVVVFFPQVCGPTHVEDDRIAAKRVAAKIQAPDGAVVVIDRISDASTLMSAYGQLDAFVGTRLHSCIFALNQYIPVLPIAYQHKTTGIFDMLALPVPVLPIADVTAEKLILGLRIVLDNKDALRTVIKEQVSTIRRQASVAGYLIAEDVCREA